MINHITVHLTQQAIRKDNRDELGALMHLLGFREVPADDKFEHGYNVRWFAKVASPTVHFVTEPEAPGRSDVPALGHFCIVVSPGRFKTIAQSQWCCRNSGSGRIWVRFDACRVEVRSSR